MKNLKKKLLTIACVVGLTGLGYALPARAFESKIPTDSPIADGGGEVGTKGITIYKTLENGVKITEIDFGADGKIDYVTLYQSLPYGRAIVEVDKDADGDIDYRITLNNDGSLLYESNLPNGSVEIKLIK